MKNISCILVVLFFISCQAVRVQTDYDKSTDFSNYTTYNYFENLETGLSKLDEKRLISVLDIQLKQKGLLLSEEPDFLINIEGGTYKTPKSNTVGVGVGSSGRSIGGGVSIGISVGNSKLQRELIFDFVDVQKDALFWQASTQSAFKENMTPEDRTLKMNEIVSKVLEKYPPTIEK